jgi:hypothetical protein
LIPASLEQLGLKNETYTSFVNGKTLPGALNVELDILLAPFGAPVGGSFVRVWGIGLREIVQSNDLKGFLIGVYGGMQRGLPLANPNQAGLLTQGFIFQAFGNWVGLDQTLDLIILPGTGTADKPKNIIQNWKKGTKFKDAIQQTLSTAFPTFKSDIKISDDLVLAEDDIGYYQTVEQYAQYVKQMSFNIIGGDYNGVDIRLTKNTFFVYDATVEQKPLEIEFKDLIGQPTWIDAPIMQVKTVMRADISVGDFIKLPQGLATTTAAAQSSLLDLKTSFQGVFLVNQVRHVGNFRQPDAASWVTVIDASPTKLS